MYLHYPTQKQCADFQIFPFCFCFGSASVGILRGGLKDVHDKGLFNQKLLVEADVGMVEVPSGEVENIAQKSTTFGAFQKYKKGFLV